MKLGTIASPFLYDTLACCALRPSIPVAARCPPTVPLAGPCCRATEIGPSCSQKSPVAASYFRQGRGKDPARRRNLIHELKSAFAACGLALLAAIPAAAEDLTIALGYSRTVDPLGRGVTTLFISPNDVRYRTRNYYQGNKDWVFNVPSGRLVMIDHDGKRYAESDAEEREEVRRLEREEAETRRLPGLRDGKIEMRAIPPVQPGKFLVEKGSKTRRYAGYECEQYVISTDAAAGPQEPNRRDLAVW
jgi:hypothetical protein